MKQSIFKPMKQSIFKPFTVINLVIFMFLIGCGSSSPNSPNLERAEETADANNLDIPTGNTPPSKDHEILNEYLTEFNRLDPEQIKSLASDIKSFDIRVDRDNSQFKTLILRMHVKTDGHNACRAKDYLVTTGIYLPIQDSNSIFIGRHSNNYEFNIHCTDSDCDEMIASIRRINPEGLVLIGLKSTHYDSGSYLNRQYKSRFVDITEYFTVTFTPDEYENKCLSNEEDTDLWAGPF